MATISDALAIAVQHHQAGRLQAAEQVYRQILATSPSIPEAWYLLGMIGYQQGQYAIAIEHIGRAIGLKPDYAEAHFNLGNAYKAQGKLDEAVACYRTFLKLKPDNPDVHNNLGNALQAQGKLDEAIACYRSALELKPDFAEALNNLGFSLQCQRQLKEALACYDKSLAHKPDHALAHSNRALVWLLMGDFERGWPEYEWRWQTKELPPRRFVQPVWNGEPLTGKTILLHAEQGLGDTIQFIRYVPLIKQMGATVIVECQPALLNLLEGFAGIDKLIARSGDLPAFDLHAPLLNVPGILKTSLETIPASIPYLVPNPSLLDQWQKRLLPLDGFKIGINWQGNSHYPRDRFRSVPLRCFASLARVPGVRLISLQKGKASEQLAEVRDLFPIADFTDELDQKAAFLDTAAVMKNLDLVISVDAAPAHLAGALGVPTWVALPLVPNWRWLLDRPDSPWYPDVRLFRQQAIGVWEPVFEQMAAELTTLVAAKNATQPWLVEVSAGELLDKLSILHIKAERITDQEKLRNVKLEIEALTKVSSRIKSSPALAELVLKLKEANERIWEIEDAIREHEKRQDFGAEFIELARSVYLTNDQRMRLKREINALLKSRLVEEKSYECNPATPASNVRLH
jgi:Flp pilus assembly protein TadD